MRKYYITSMEEDFKDIGILGESGRGSEGKAERATTDSNDVLAGKRSDSHKSRPGGASVVTKKLIAKGRRRLGKAIIDRERPDQPDYDDGSDLEDTVPHRPVVTPGVNKAPGTVYYKNVKERAQALAKKPRR